MSSLSDKYTAGCGEAVTDEAIGDFIVDGLSDFNASDLEMMFVKGFFSGLAFPTCPPDAEVFGLSLRAYMENAMGIAWQEMVKDAISHALASMSGGGGDGE